VSSPGKKLSFYIAVREILCISDNIHLSLIYYFLGQHILKVSPPVPPLEWGTGVLPRKIMNFYIDAREILRISSDINLTLIHWFRRQKMLKPSPPLPPLDAGDPGSSPEKKHLSVYIDVGLRDF